MKSPASQSAPSWPARAWHFGLHYLWLLAVCCATAPAWASDSPKAQPPEALVTVNAASYIPQLAPGAIAALFGNRLVERTQIAETVPLPTELQGLAVRLLDNQNNAFSASLFFVSPGQINYLIPDQIALGEARIVVTHDAKLLAQGTLIITNSAPALFTVSANGKGEPAALTTSDGETFYAVTESTARPLKPIPGPQYLLLFGTGFRYAERLYVKLGQKELQPLYVGAQGLLAGLDQINLRLPDDLPPGALTLQIISDGYPSNPVQVRLAGE